MLLSKNLHRAALAAALFVSLPLLAQKPFHLELEASPGAVFPYLGKFGDVELHVYASGVRAEALWLNSFSRNGQNDVTVMNPLGRVYVEVPISDISTTIGRLAGAGVSTEQIAVPVLGSATHGKVGTLEATRYRLVYGPNAWIDLWMTQAVAENRQFRRIIHSMLDGISPGTARMASKFPGTPVHVELNFRRYKKVQLLKLKKISMSADDEKDALTLGPLYMRSSVLEKLLEP